MLKCAQLSLWCLFIASVLGCGEGTSSPPTVEEAAKNDAAMETDMKTMMQQVPQRPK